ncbi:hypothetical protein BDW22DRAFT_299901 [Trametopsis cervina]|nr:hypothetical protein BDW22DRAFT_299901 [Trametopsis cervina]
MGEALQALYPSPLIGTFAVHQRNTNIDVDVENPDRDWHWQLVHVYITYARRTTTSKQTDGCTDGCISSAYPCPSEARRLQTFMKHERERSMHRCRLAHPARLGESICNDEAEDEGGLRSIHTVPAQQRPHPAFSPHHARSPSPIARRRSFYVLRSRVPACSPVCAPPRPLPCEKREARGSTALRQKHTQVLLDHMYVTIKCNSTIN